MADVLLGAQDIMCQRMSAEEALFKFIEYQLGGAVAIEVDFLYDHVLLFLYLMFGKGGMEEYVGEKFKTAFQMLGECRGIDAGLFLGGKGIQLASHTVDTVADMVGAAVFGALKDRMLYEVGNALLSPLLVARAYTDENPSVCYVGGGRTEDYAYAVRKGMVLVHFKLKGKN